MVKQIKAYGKMVDTLSFEEAMLEVEYFNEGSGGKILGLYPVSKDGYELVGLSEEANVDSVYVTPEVAKRLVETGKAAIDR